MSVSMCGVCVCVCVCVHACVEREGKKIHLKLLLHFSCMTVQELNAPVHLSMARV